MAELLAVAPSLKTVDARGTLCPIPTVKASLALEAMAGGEVLDLLADDPVTRRDLPVWCRENGHEVLSVADAPDRGFRVKIRKKASA